ncbi:hypothetical protein ABIB29_001876 [Arthrobacter sp. UYEF36]
MFAHYSAIASSGYKSLEENQKVQFDITQGPKGCWKVRPVAVFQEILPLMLPPKTTAPAVLGLLNSWSLTKT